MSLGTSQLFNGNCDTATAFNMAGAAAINTLRTSGVIAFASAGNDGSATQMTSPACLSNVVSVGATDDSDNVAGFTNSNSTTDIMAPGVDITSTGLANGTSTFTGTSQASPHAAGCAALLLDAGDALTPDAIEAFLKASPVQVTDPKNGLTFPRIDCSPITQVDIDIKPSDFPNSINPRSGEVIPVAILTTTVFDATTVDPLSVEFGPNGATELTHEVTLRTSMETVTLI